MAVLELVKPQDKDTVQVLEALLEQEKESGIDLCLAYRFPDGREEVAFTGFYKSHPAEALRALMELLLLLLQTKSPPARGRL